MRRFGGKQRQVSFCEMLESGLKRLLDSPSNWNTDRFVAAELHVI